MQVDQEVQAEVSGMTLSLLLQLPAANSVSQTPAAAAAAAALYVLPARSLMGAGCSSSGSGLGAAAAAAAGPLAHLKLLLLPLAAAAELVLWVEQLQPSQQQLQPLLEDMAVAIEACGAAAAAPQLSNAAFVWGQAAAAAAGRVLSLAHSCPQLRLCEDMMAVCCQQLLVALRRTQPLAAGALPSAEEASLVAATAAAGGLPSAENFSQVAATAAAGGLPSADEASQVAATAAARALSSAEKVSQVGATATAIARATSGHAAADNVAKASGSSSQSNAAPSAKRGPVRVNAEGAEAKESSEVAEPEELEGSSAEQVEDSSSKHEVTHSTPGRAAPTVPGNMGRLWWWCVPLAIASVGMAYTSGPLP